MNSPCHLSLLLPGLLGPVEPEVAAAQPSHGSLLTLLARADRTPTGQPPGDLERELLALFPLPATTVERAAVAPLLRLADGLTLEAGGYLCAEAVELMPEQDQLYLTAIDEVALNGDEAVSLTESLNRLYLDDGWSFDFGDPHRLYLHLPDGVPAITTTAPVQLLGAALRDALPTGDGALVWHGVINEMQMLCHGESFNLARDGRGERLVSGLWLWGGGGEGDLGGDKAPWQRLQGALPLLHGLGCHYGIETAAGDSLLPVDAPTLAVDDGAYRAAHAALAAEWGEAIAALERRWLAPALEALRHGELEWLDLYPVDGYRYRITRRSLRRWWRRRRDLAHGCWGRDDG